MKKINAAKTIYFYSTIQKSKEKRQEYGMTHENK